MQKKLATSLLIAAVLSAPALAQGKSSDAPKADAAKDKASEIPPPTVSVTKHTGTFGGQKISYTATAGETYLTDEKGKPTATIFSTAYVKDGKDPNRPVTFLYNGGPGSGSLWLHMGAFGPKRVAIPNDGRDDGAPPYPIINNPSSLLDVTDIVFIDPVGTGFSRAGGYRSEGILGRHQGCEIHRPVHPKMAGYQRPLERAEVHRRRKLWHHPLRRAGERTGGQLQ